MFEELIGDNEQFINQKELEKLNKTATLKKKRKKNKSKNCFDRNSDNFVCIRCGSKSWNNTRYCWECYKNQRQSQVKVITMNEFEGFSEDLIDAVKLILNRWERFPVKINKKWDTGVSK